MATEGSVFFSVGSCQVWLEWWGVTTGFCCYFGLPLEICVAGLICEGHLKEDHAIDRFYHDVYDAVDVSAARKKGVNCWGLCRLGGG